MSGHEDGIVVEHEEHVNHEAWVIPYADLLTLLMAMFIALFAMSTVDMSKFKALAIGFNEALNGPSMDTGVFAKTAGNTPLDLAGAGADTSLQGGAVGPDNSPKTNSMLAQLANQQANLDVERSAEKQALTVVKQKIEQRAAQLGLGGKLGLRLDDRGLVVTIVTDKILFDSGSAAIKPEGDGLLQVVVNALQSVDNPILIDGYTDSVPIATAQYPSNWELSGARAGSVARFFEANGMDRTRMRAEGLADLDPVASNATSDGRAQNRRVEIVVQSKLVQQALNDAGVGSNASTTTTTTPPIERPVTPNVQPHLGLG
jgi:chemotaxis protein MotB